MIKFEGSQIGIEFPDLDYNQGYTIANMYQYLQQFQLDPNTVYLTLDGQSILSPQDNSPIGQYFGPNSILYVMAQQTPTFVVYVDGSQVLEQQLQNMPIIELLQGLQLGPNVSVDFYEGQTQAMLQQNVDINQPLYNFTNGNLNIIINITQLQQQLQQQQSQQSIGKIPSTRPVNLGAQEYLQSLVLLENISLFIDPDGQFVIYKFHFPTLIQGYLQRSRGKEAKNVSHFDWVKADWVERNKIKYCSMDDYGFAVTWEDGTINSIKIKQI